MRMGREEEVASKGKMLSWAVWDLGYLWGPLWRGLVDKWEHQWGLWKLEDKTESGAGHHSGGGGDMGLLSFTQSKWGKGRSR